jgi:outer membrane protein OmpA-like peptidoglycan-associated protein
MKLKKPILAGTVALLMLTGCYNEPGLVTDNSYNRTKTGAATGAVAGALLGYNAKGKNSGKNALIGGLLGAAVGSAVGYSMDKQANEIASALGTGVNNDPLARLDPNNQLIVSKTNNYVKIMFRDPMMFASGSANLQSSARSKVAKVGQLLANYPQTVVGVAGFTDNEGSYAYNQGLSQRRANTVGNLLSRNGRPLVKGCSYDKAIVPNNSERNKALNRRVEVYLYSDKANMGNPCY